MSEHENKYIKDGRFDICSMINDDFVLAIRKMWNETHYTSCLKLLVSFVDTMAFVDQGDSTSANFKNWLNSYVDLSPVGITADELWEHRNALLHMTTYDSRKVSSGTVRRLIPCVGHMFRPLSDASIGVYPLRGLIMAVMNGLENYITAMDRDESMRLRFCDNYPRTASDSQLAQYEVR